MFGVVPKVLWGNVTDVDDENRILLATRTLLAVDRARSRIMLVDTGCGSKWPAEKAPRYAIAYDPQAIPNALTAIGLTAEAVTDVVVTHLHFDHNGGLTFWYDDPDGKTCLQYPNACHWVHRQHWDHAREPFLKDRASFLREDFDSLANSDRLSLVEGDDPRCPLEGVEWFVSRGHTPYQLHPIFGSGDSRLMFVGDVVPTVNHLRPGWVMAYDVEPLRTIEEKRRIYRRCLEDGMMLAFPHDPSVGGVVIDGKIDRPIVAKTLPL